MTLDAEGRHAEADAKFNEMLRRGLASQRITARRQTFRVAARDLGDLKPGLSLDNVAELIDQMEGSLHR